MHDHVFRRLFIDPILWLSLPSKLDMVKVKPFIKRLLHLCCALERDTGARIEVRCGTDQQSI
jgi:hypothetical protein